MGAFDGYVPEQYYSGVSKPTKLDYEYINGQTAFHLYSGFGINELKKLLLEAENNNEASIYFRVSSDKRGIQARFDTWYIRAFIEHYCKEII